MRNGVMQRICPPVPGKKLVQGVWIRVGPWFLGTTWVGARSPDGFVGQRVRIPPWRFGFDSQAVGPGLNAPGFLGTTPLTAFS